MARALVWMRLPRGRVWHVYAGETNPWAVALCGQAGGIGAEEQDAKPPRGARPCPACREVAEQAARVAAEAAELRAEQRFDPWDDDPEPRTLTDPDDDGELPDVQGLDGEVVEVQ